MWTVASPSSRRTSSRRDNDNVARTPTFNLGAPDLLRCAFADALGMGQSVRMTLASSISVREATPEDDDAVVVLVTAYLTWAHTILRDRHGVEEPPTEAALVQDSLAGFRRPSAMILLAERDGDPIGVGAVRGLGTDVAEVKRMYVDPKARGFHVGAALLDRLLNESHHAGAKVARLDTVEFMTDAQRLYRSRGFLERPPYDGTEIPEHLQKYWLFFERYLQAR
jgi:GNAT superfamily N-acetyltransferase